jgi:ketosteroid isomerase-like protein
MNDSIEVVKRFFDTLNRNELEEIANYFDPQIERIEPADFPSAGTYRGITEVQEHLRAGRSTWAEGSCEPEEFFRNVEKVVAYLHVHVRLHNSQEWIDGRFADGFVVRNGKIIQYLTFGERLDALTWAGIEQ